MSVGICFAYSVNSYYRTQWLCNVTGFGVSAYERGMPPGLANPEGVISVETAADLPLTDHDLVVCSPRTARIIQPTVDLPDFEHPENAVYFFGADTIFLSDDDLGGVQPDHVVAVPVASPRENDEIYSFVACAVVLYDRIAKRGLWWPTP